MIFPNMPRKDTTRVALLDGDIIAFKAASVCSSRGMQADELEFILQVILDEWMGKWFEASIMCLSSSGNFRKAAYPDYKAHRKSDPPELLPDAYDMLYNWGFPVKKIPTLEADDVMGILATEVSDDLRVIVSTDKDMQQVPAWNYNPDKDAFPWRVSEAESRRMLAYQIIRGDPGDGYKGIAGMGDVKTNRWLDSEWDGTIKHVKSLFDDEAEYIKMHTLAKILTADDYARET